MPAAGDRLPRMNIAIVLMGVSGAGKSTIGVRLAKRLKREFLEGDRFHPPANIEKMGSGSPLDDADRTPWLAAIAAAIDAAREARKPIVVTCSALKRSYRAVLAGDNGDVIFVFLQGRKALIAGRLADRPGHFMPPRLLDSQFAALEEPDADEPCCAVAIEATPDAIVDAIIEQLGSETGSIRKARAGDAPRLQAIARTAFATYVARMGREPAPMSANYAAAVAAGHAIVAEGDGVIVGYLIGWPEGDAYFVENVAIDPARQGEGFGRALLQHTIEQAKRLNLPALRLYTNAAMAENLALYRRMGFVETHRTAQGGFDRVHLRLPIEL
jgi:carbohydrate kinase (thermoresistant glucokinase family)